MGRLADDYALVLRAGDTIEADLARNLFGEADIPCLSPGRTSTWRSSALQPKTSSAAPTSTDQQTSRNRHG
jgi:hypothetical protein